MKSKQQKYEEAVARNIRGIARSGQRMAYYRGIPLDMACRKIGVRKNDMFQQHEVSVALSR